MQCVCNVSNKQLATAHCLRRISRTFDLFQGFVFGDMFWSRCSGPGYHCTGKGERQEKRKSEETKCGPMDCQTSFPFRFRAILRGIFRCSARIQFGQSPQSL